MLQLPGFPMKKMVHKYIKKKRPKATTKDKGYLGEIYYDMNAPGLLYPNVVEHQSLADTSPTPSPPAPWKRFLKSIKSIHIFTHVLPLDQFYPFSLSLRLYLSFSLSLSLCLSLSFSLSLSLSLSVSISPSLSISLFSQKDLNWIGVRWWGGRNPKHILFTQRYPHSTILYS